MTDTKIQKMRKKKRCVIQLRVAEEDKPKYFECAQLAGMTLSDLIRTTIIKQPPKRKKKTLELQELIRMNGSLGIIGSNINQLAKAMNDRGHYYINIKPMVITNALERIAALSDEILNYLQGDHQREGKREWEATSEVSND